MIERAVTVKMFVPVSRVVFAMIVVAISVFAKNNHNEALFGVVKNVSDNDVLNLRSAPDYRSRKVGSYPNGAYVSIDHCVKTERSHWCRITPLPQENYGNSRSGWVNAKFLSFTNRGYVAIKRKKKFCCYAIGCNSGYCRVVTRVGEKRQGNKLHIELYPREELIPTDRYGAADPSSDGYCITDRYVNRR